MQTAHGTRAFSTPSPDPDLTYISSGPRESAPKPSVRSGDWSMQTASELDFGLAEETVVIGLAEETVVIRNPV